jgi:hypothetical protein
MSNPQKLGLSRTVDRATWMDPDRRKDIRAEMRQAAFAQLARMSDTHMQDRPPTEHLHYRPPGDFMRGERLPDVPEDKALSGDEPWESVEVRLALVVKEIA